MRYVLDSCVALKWVLPETDTPAAVRIRTGFLRGDHELLAPDIFPVEVAHALAMAERKGIIRPPLGARRLRNILSDSPDLHSHLPLLPRAFALASQARIGVYDCLYVALAERQGCAMLTADDRLARVLGPTHPFIVLLDSL
jgi:predicted nucleic acid-binding protein